MKSHTKRVMGLAVEKKLGFVYSVSEDGKFKVTEINSVSVVTDLTPGKSGLKALIYNPERQIFILGDGDGFVYIYNSSLVKLHYLLTTLQHPPELLLSIQT